MRWIALWLMLTGVYVVGWAVAHWATGASLMPAKETWVHFAVVPPIQVLALWVVATVRQARRAERTQADSPK
jgi:membrane protein implicated in regulation of membrane protease activity